MNPWTDHHSSDTIGSNQGFVGVNRDLGEVGKQAVFELESVVALLGNQTASIRRYRNTPNTQGTPSISAARRCSVGQHQPIRRDNVGFRGRRGQFRAILRLTRLGRQCQRRHVAACVIRSRRKRRTMKNDGDVRNSMPKLRALTLLTGKASPRQQRLYTSNFVTQLLYAHTIFLGGIWASVEDREARILAAASDHLDVNGVRRSLLGGRHTPSSHPSPSVRFKVAGPGRWRMCLDRHDDPRFCEAN